VDIAHSRNGVPIRLTAERWQHIVENHNEVAGYYDDVLRAIESPDVVGKGYRGALIAYKGYGRHRYLCVIYKEISPQDGFVVSAYFSSRVKR